MEPLDGGRGGDDVSQSGANRKGAENQGGALIKCRSLDTSSGSRSGDTIAPVVANHWAPFIRRRPVPNLTLAPAELAQLNDPANGMLEQIDSRADRRWGWPREPLQSQLGPLAALLEVRPAAK